MKVLFVCPFVPWPLVNGGKIRTFHLIKSASRHAEIHSNQRRVRFGEECLYWDVIVLDTRDGS